MQTSVNDIGAAGVPRPLASHRSDYERHPAAEPRVGVPVCTEILDRACEALFGPDVHAGMDRLRASLSALRKRLPADEWAAVGTEVRSHPVHPLLLESPFASRAHAKPRGYAGDAVLMDLIYGIARPADGLTPLGGMLYGYEFDSPCFQSVRTRRAILAREIDQVASFSRTARILAVASGHLRELEWSRAARAGAVSITALDQDPRSLGLVAEQYRSHGVSTLPASVRDLLRQAVDCSDVDLAYAAGLYDYLPDDVARTLTSTLFRMLRSGGRLLIANFTPATDDAAYMEAVMDWRLIYRSAESVRALAGGLPPHEVESIQQYFDSNGHIAYMRVTKR